MTLRKLISLVLLINLLGTNQIIAQTNSSATLNFAPEGKEIGKVWHLGRVTGDLERIIQFYHDLLGLDLRGERNAHIPFYSVDSINEFVNAPVGTEFRAAFMPIPASSATRDPANQIYLEAFEYRNIDRHLAIPALYDTGASNLSFFVNNLDDIVSLALEAGVTIITENKEPVQITTISGKQTRAIMLRDPDGYPVEVRETSSKPTPQSLANNTVLGASMSLVVENIENSISFYQEFIGAELQISAVSPWQNNENRSRLRNIPNVDFRQASFTLPGSAIFFELIEYRHIQQKPYRPVFQDIGFGHIAFTVNDIETIHKRIKQLGIKTLSQNDSWTDINENTRAIYTRDYDGFFIEIIETQ